MLALLTTFLLVPSPQAPELPTSPQMRFVDFSRDLENPHVAVVVGRLGKLKEGKRERIKEGGHLGGGSAKSVVSGTQYYKVPARARIEDLVAMVGVGVGSKPELEFDLQVARLPDGNEHRQTMTGTGAVVDEGVLALWVVEKQPKGRKVTMLHVIPFNPKADLGKDPERAFVDNMSDFCKINTRMADLRRLLAESEAPVPAKRRELADGLRHAVETALDLRNPAHDALVVQHVAPLQKRAQERIAELTKDA